MTWLQFVAVLKSLVTLAGVYVVAKGWISLGAWNDILAGAVLLATSALSWRENSTAALVSTVSTAPGVKKLRVVVDDEVAPELERKVRCQKVEVVAEGTKFWMG